MNAEKLLDEIIDVTQIMTSVLKARDIEVFEKNLDNREDIFNKVKTLDLSSKECQHRIKIINELDKNLKDIIEEVKNEALQNIKEGKAKMIELKNTGAKTKSFSNYLPQTNSIDIKC